MSRTIAKPKTENLLCACSTGDLIAIKRILAHPVLRRSENSRRDNHNWTGLHHAIKNGDIECIKELLKSPHVPVYAKTFEGMTALHLACKLPGTSVDLVRLLVQTHPDLVESVNNEKVCALHLAIEEDRGDLAKVLIEIGKADVNVVDLDGEYALFYAIRQQNYDLVRYILQSTATHVTKPNANSIDPLTLDLNLFRIQPRTPEHFEGLKEIVRSYYRESRNISVFIKQIFTCIGFGDSEMCNFFLDEFYLQSSNNQSYSDHLHKICEANILTDCFKLCLVASLHESINPKDSAPDPEFCQRYGNWISKICSNPLYLLFTVIADDLETYRQIAEYWWRIYSEVDTFSSRNSDAVDVLASDYVLPQRLSDMCRDKRDYTQEHFLQFIREISAPSASQAINIELLFPIYIDQCVNSFSNVKVKRKVVAFLLMFDISIYPYGFICLEDSLRDECNSAFESTGDICKDIFLYIALSHKWLKHLPERKPQTLLSIARTTIRKIVLKRENPNALDLWRLPLPTSLKAKLSYNTLSDIDQSIIRNMTYNFYDN